MSVEFYKTVCRHDRENFSERRTVRKAEPVIQRLRRGENILRNEDFLSVCRYFFEPNRRGPVVRSGRFTIGAIVCVRGSK